MRIWDKLPLEKRQQNKNISQTTKQECHKSMHDDIMFNPQTTPNDKHWKPKAISMKNDNVLIEQKFYKNNTTLEWELILKNVFISLEQCNINVNLILLLIVLQNKLVWYKTQNLLKIANIFLNFKN